MYYVNIKSFFRGGGGYDGFKSKWHILIINIPPRVSVYANYNCTLTTDNRYHIIAPQKPYDDWMQLQLLACLETYKKLCIGRDIFVSGVRHFYCS